MTRTSHPSAGHWGPFRAEVEDGRVVGIAPFADDPAPPPLIDAVPATVHHETRIARPMVRAGWLDNGPGGGEGRGREPFVPVSWERALDLVAGELARVKAAYGNEAIYAGSYGWSSAGKFHHARTHLHRLLGLFGGYVDAFGNYSFAAGMTILPRIVGTLAPITGPLTDWRAIAGHTRLFVAFGGVPLKNTQIDNGGSVHVVEGWLRRIRDAGCRFVNIGPIRDDAAEFLDAEWLPIRPNADTALMLALAHTLLVEGLHDEAFLARYCTGFSRFRAYLLGAEDGTPKDAAWAAALTEIDAETIRGLARRMAATRTMINVAWSLQRAEHGEQPFWAAAALAAMLGQIGLPGGGFACGYGATAGAGMPHRRIPTPTLPRGDNPIRRFIPVARIADMLLHPGETIDWNGRRITYPDTRLVYWVGGNPFHHHQDLNRLLAAWRRPETIVVHEPWWTPVARLADIVLPAASGLERNDMAASASCRHLFAMHQAIPPLGEARSDFAIFSRLAERLGLAAAYTEGRDEMGWLRHLYDVWRQQVARLEIDLPSFDAFWEAGHVTLPEPAKPTVLFEAFRADPDANPLHTPSGRIEIFSETIAGFGYDDCPGHPAWLAPREWLGAPDAARYPLHLISNQPRTRLHSQGDNGPVSRAAKVAGREPVWINPADAAARGIAEGDVVRLYNDRGACLAGAVVTDRVRPGVVQLATGAWFDPAEPGAPGALERHGNPNVLTADRPTSKLAQGPAAQSALVELARFDGPPPPVGAFTPPEEDGSRRVSG